jgi:hypothetical protein
MKKYINIFKEIGRRTWLALTGVACISILLVACDIEKPQYPMSDASLPIEPTISSDGKLLAVLDRIGQETPRLRIKWLDRDEPWVEIDGPKYANSIRFGLTGYQLLLTHARPGPQGASQLSRWDASQPTKQSEILFEGTRIAFPIEVKPGQVLVRMCPQPPGEGACARGHGLVWALIENGQATPIKDTRSLLYSQPNVVNGGFFWLEDEYFSKKRGDDSKREITAFPFPGGEAPQFDISHFDGKSRHLQCDQEKKRCLLKYLTDERVNGQTYVYGFKILDGSNACILKEVKGWQDHFSITPDGRSAVISLSRVSEEPRHVAVLRFTPGACEPTSIQHIRFNKEKSK